MTTAFDPIDLAGVRLPNRIVMAPMTRSRAYGPGASPTASMATYYAQRASAGLIISEGIQPSAQGQGYPDTPGLHSETQTEGWRAVTGAVHAAGGRIFAQLMHTGRIGHPSLLPPGLVPVGPSPIAAKGQVFTHEGALDFVTPGELTPAEIGQTVAQFAAAAANAIAAGFDGVEIHGANGYLVHQFLSDNANRRTDAWGGTAAKRARFAAELLAAVAAEIGAHRTALRISPQNPYNDVVEENPRETYRALVERINPLALAYLHTAEGPDRGLTLELRKQFDGVFVLNPKTHGRPTGPEDLGLIADGTADMLSFGTLFLANPDLPRRLAAGGPFNVPHRPTYYGGDDRGYTDYAVL